MTARLRAFRLRELPDPLPCSCTGQRVWLYGPGGRSVLMQCLACGEVTLPDEDSTAPLLEEIDE